MTNKNEFDDAAEWLQDEVDYDTQELAMLVMDEVVARSDVDTGRLKGNWIVSINKETDRVRGGIDGEDGAVSYTSSLTLANAVIKRAMKSGKNVDEIWIQNNLPYAGVIDDGLYPDPVKLGTRINKSGTRKNPITPEYFKFSSGGYTKNNPQGISEPAIKAALERSK